MAIELVSCKHCGFKFRIDVKDLINPVRVVRGLIDLWREVPKNAEYIDIQCPKCNKWFEQKVES